jgi:hypothetical protein
MVLKNSYEKIVLILSLITLILVIYYLVKTYFNHNIILEKFSDKMLYNDVKFRDCQVYFTNDKKKCDRDYAANNKDTCKYKFENWKEIDKIGDGAIKKHKVYVDNKLNEDDYANIREETRCFYKLEKDDDKSRDNIMLIDNNYYTYNDFYPFSIDNSICNIAAPIKKGIKYKQFYEFILDKENNLVDIKKVSINAQQNSFIVDSTFTASKFIEQYGNGLEYHNENKFKVYKVSKFPDLDIKVHKFTYNYLCYNTQIKNYSIINAKIQLNNFLKLSNKEEIIQLPDNINTNIPGIRWDNYKNSNSKSRPDKKSEIIKALEDRRKVVQDEMDEKDEATSTALSLIKQEIIDDSVIRKYQLTTYIDSNKEIWEQAKFLNQFSVHNYKREYLTKSANATIDNTIVDVTIRIKNNFKEGLKMFKVDGYYNNDINYIKGKNQIESIHQFEGKMVKGINNFKGLNNLTNGMQNPNSEDTYSMMFSGYFYVHETGNYKFGTTSDNTSSYIYINDKLVVINDRPNEMITVEKDYGTIKKGDICKIDIYFGENYRNDNLEIFWRFNNSNRIYSSEWNNKTWIFYTDPNINPAINSSKKIPTIKGNSQYVDGREHKLLYKTTQDNTVDIYYEFKNTDFIYDVIANRDIDTKILVVGGGGGGGAFGGGGGGGGVLFKESEKLKTNDICTISIGEGGNGAPIYNNGVNGNNGKDSSIKINNQEYIAKGGGGGGTRKQYPYHGVNGNDGSSGGGGSHANSGRQAIGGTSNKNSYNGWNSYGNAGGKGRNGTGGGNPNHASGGGGGAGYSGEDAVQSSRQYRTWPNDGGGGDGGIGINLSNHFGSNVGDNGYFGGGGGGNTYWNSGRVGYGNSYEGISDNKRKYGGGGDGGFNGNRNQKGGNGMNGTGGGGGGGKTGNNQSGSGGSGIAILRIANSPFNKLAKCNYYIPPISQITPYLPKSDVMNSKISFEVRNQANPKSLFYSSYIYLKKGYYKFNFDIDTSGHKKLYTKSKILIYDDKDKKTFISVYKDNLVTKKWVYIPDTKYYIINLCIVYISDGKYDIPFSLKARYTREEKTNVIQFSNSELSIDKYEGLPSSDSRNYKDMTGYIYRQDAGHIDKINNMADEYNNNFNKFLESYFLLNTSFGKVIDYFKLLGKRNNEKKSNINIQKIDKLIEYLNNINLKEYFDKTNDNLELSSTAKSIFAQNTILDINDYITFKQYKQADKNELKGVDETFDMLKHAERSIYIEVF